MLRELLYQLLYLSGAVIAAVAATAILDSYSHGTLLSGNVMIQHSLCLGNEIVAHAADENDVFDLGQGFLYLAGNELFRRQ